MDIDSRIYSPRDLLEAELERIFKDRPLHPYQIEHILDFYSEPWRAYHNSEHILKMLQILKSIQADLQADYIQLIEVMIVYHDVIFKLKKDIGWNEWNSSKFARVQLKTVGYDSAFINKVMDGIQCTTSHYVPEALARSRDYILPFIDIDLLAGLGSTWDECRKNTWLIWVESSPVTTLEDYRAGCIDWAKSFLKRDRIFQSVHFAHYESVVRENLTKMV